MRGILHRTAKVLLMTLLIVSTLMVDIRVPNEQNIVYAAGVRVPASSTTNTSTVATDYDVPAMLERVPGKWNELQNVINKVYPPDKNNGQQYSGKGLPYTLADPKTGEIYNGFCAQSYIDSAPKMEAQGVVSDPRLLKIVDVVAGGNPHSMTDAQRIAIQVVIWGALNNNFSPDLFSSGKISTKNSDYGAMTSVPDHVQKIAAAWGDIVSTPKEKIAPVELKGKDKVITAHCSSDPNDPSAVLEIDWGLMGGFGVNDITKVADITYSGFDGEVLHTGTPGVYTELQGYDVKSKDSAHYLKIPDASTSGKSEIKVDINYKGAYAPLNNVSLITYSGGGGYQPFMHVTESKDTYTITVDWRCPPPPPPKIPPPPGGGCASLDLNTEQTSTDLRWYNMLGSFGEMKNGIGYNESGITTSGKYASSRSGETFEAMNGVPTTERFYTNLGGTEGYIDVEYSYETLNQDFGVTWKTPWEYDYECGTAEAPATCTATGTNYFDQIFNWDFKAMHIKSATFRVLGDGAVRNSPLDVDVKVINSKKEPGSYVLQPNINGLEVGPGTGDDKFNFGAMNSWAPDQGCFDTEKVYGRESIKEDRKDEAYGYANANVGEIFAQNDKLEITINGKTYTVVPEVNKKSSLAYVEGAEYVLDATDGKALNYFNPVGEKWDVWNKVPVMGYNGNPEDDASRSVAGTPILQEDIPLDILKGNGIYPFQDDEEGNYLDYESLVTTIVGDTKDVMSDIGELNDGKNKGTATVYESALNPTNQGVYNAGNNLLLQYTNWQVPTTKENFKHSGNEPDMNKDASLGDNPSYRSVNPILLHNPTTALYSWVSDVPDSQLQDQRINAKDERFNKHPSTQSGNPRQYIDYDFQVTIPNVAAFDKYWSQVAGNSQAAGFEDNDFTYPGTLGKGYKGNAVSQITDRSYENPYLGESGWDVSKWTTAKYIKFPYDVYYYKNSGEQGGDVAGFYDAGTWIKLYDDNQTVRVGDPIKFNFHVASEQKDVKDGIIYVTSETLNSQGSLTGNAESLYRSGEQYVNGTRNTAGTNVGSYNTARDGEAIYSAANQMNVDGVGRIGNVLVSDATDPAWSSVFWKTNNGKIDTTTPVQKDYGLTFNYYDSTVLGNGTGFAAYDRFHTLTPWHGEMEAIHSLPLTTNVFTKGKEDQTVKLGYSIGGSVQTVGDYDYSMWIYPQNQLAGKFTTGNAGQHFKLISSDPFMSGAKYQEYYDSSVNNTLHGSAGILGKDYQAKYQHIISSSLADPRMKMSGWEKSSATYQQAVQLGSSKKTLTGTPSWMVIPRSLRTLMGSDQSQGRWGPTNENGNNQSGAKDAPGSADCPCSYENAQKWNWNYSLPQNTKIWFDQNAANKAKDGTPKFESPSKDQYIITSMAFRTKTSRTTYPGAGDEWQTNIELPAIEFGDQYLVTNAQSIPDWDLTMYTNTGANTLPDIQTPTKNVPSGITPSYDPSVPMTWDPSQEGDISAPMLDIIWWNYSKPSTTDKDSIGTH